MRFVILLLALAACDDKSPTRGTPAPGSARPSSAPSASAPVGSGQCAIEPCHGIDLKCSAVKEPVMCTDIYMLGDFCRQFAKCERKGDACTMAPSTKLDDCAACIRGCADAGTDCDKQCRQKLGVP